MEFIPSYVPYSVNDELGTRFLGVLKGKVVDFEDKNSIKSLIQLGVLCYSQKFYKRNSQNKEGVDEQDFVTLYYSDYLELSFDFAVELYQLLKFSMEENLGFPEERIWDVESVLKSPYLIKSLKKDYLKRLYLEEMVDLTGGGFSVYSGVDNVEESWFDSIKDRFFCQSAFLTMYLTFDIESTMTYKYKGPDRNSQPYYKNKYLLDCFFDAVHNEDLETAHEYIEEWNSFYNSASLLAFLIKEIENIDKPRPSNKGGVSARGVAYYAYYTRKSKELRLTNEFPSLKSFYELSKLFGPNYKNIQTFHYEIDNSEEIRLKRSRLKIIKKVISHLPPKAKEIAEKELLKIL
ncbi:hypothetical protein [Mangrovimonas sp. TPBH4]|uniref:hypothetical protein n=1 Tax=Mangrovimonas sp. TPBH4 TaxID=1645914 RepID=UPI0006B444F0|nr:hypothetical protein [Mangrovimonas sp. TPBH4]